MSRIRWQKISEALARQGHEVDIATNESRWEQDTTPVAMAPRLRRVPLPMVDWRQYDVVKTLFHLGFETLKSHGGASHPFIISKLGSVVGSKNMPGIYFYGAVRERLYASQRQIHRTSRYVTVLSPAARDLWFAVHGNRKRMLLVPGGVDHEIPPPGANPYAGIGERICLFSGNIYTADVQPEANRVLVDKLNRLGQSLAASDIRVCFQGLGDTSRLDGRFVTNLGSCSQLESWNYMQHAAVGVVVSAGPFMHNNESTKVYHYLRAGLPVVLEQGFPNDWVVLESGLGFVVPSEDIQQMAARVREACERPWDRERAIRYVQANHTWDCRALVYKDVLASDPGPSLLDRVRGQYCALRSRPIARR